MIKKLHKITLLFSLICSICSETEAKVIFRDQLSVAMGMVNSSFSQQEGAFDDGVKISSGSVSVISLDFNYEIFSTRRKSYSFRFTGSGMAGEISKYYTLSGGQKYYFGADGTNAIYDDPLMQVTTNPIFRYYAGWSIGIYSLIYEPAKEVRSDLGIEFGGYGGILYSANSKTAYKCELSALKGTGVETTSMNIQIFFGASYFLKSLF